MLGKGDINRHTLIFGLETDRIKTKKNDNRKDYLLKKKLKIHQNAYFIMDTKKQVYMIQFQKLTKKMHNTLTL